MPAPCGRPDPVAASGAAAPRRRGRKVGDLDRAGAAVRLGLHHGDQVEPQQRQVVQVVGRERLAPQVGVNQAQPPESPGTAAQPPDVGNLELARVADNHLADRAGTGQQHAHLAADLARESAQVASQFGRNHLVGADLPPVGTLKSAALRGLESANVAEQRSHLRANRRVWFAKSRNCYACRLGGDA